MKTKKHLVITVILVLLFSLALNSCGKEEEKEASVEKKEQLVVNKDTGKTKNEVKDEDYKKIAKNLEITNKGDLYAFDEDKYIIIPLYIEGELDKSFNARAFNLEITGFEDVVSTLELKKGSSLEGQFDQKLSENKLKAIYLSMKTIDFGHIADLHITFDSEEEMQKIMENKEDNKLKFYLELGNGESLYTLESNISL